MTDKCSLLIYRFVERPMTVDCDSLVSEENDVVDEDDDLGEADVHHERAVVLERSYLLKFNK